MIVNGKEAGTKLNFTSQKANIKNEILITQKKHETPAGKATAENPLQKFI